MGAPAHEPESPPDIRTAGGERRWTGRAAQSFAALLLFWTLNASAQNPASTVIPQTGYTGLSPLDRAATVLPDYGYETKLSGKAGTAPTPLEQEAANVEQGGLFRRLGTSLPLLPAKVGKLEGFGLFHAELDKRTTLPLFEYGLRPDDAEIKLGRLYLDWRSITLAYLVSDNINQSFTRRKLGHIMVVRTEVALLYQLTETLRLAVGGEFGWLPLRGEVGFTDPLLDLEFSAAPLAVIQLSYEIPTPTWTFLFADTFQVRRETFGFGRNFDILQRSPVDLVDQAGRYTYSVRQVAPTQLRDQRTTVDFQNTVLVQASRLYPTQTRVTAVYQHDDIFYGSATNLLPRTLDQVNLVVGNERENLRFKPFGQFTATKVANVPGWDRQLRGGLRGPVTDYFEFFADFGYLWSADGTNSTTLFTLGLQHEPKHNMRHSIIFTRTLVFPERGLGELLNYNVDYMFHPDMLGTIILSRSTFDFLNNPGTGGEQHSAAGRISWLAGPKLTLRPGMVYTTGQTFGPGGSSFEIFTARAEALYEFGPRFRGEFIYNYEERSSSIQSQSYHEHFITVALTKYF